MSARKIRRAVDHAARKAARKAGFPAPSPAPAIPAPPPEPETSIPEPGLPFPSLASMSPVSPAAPVQAERHAQPFDITVRHNGGFQLLTTETALGFEALKQSFIGEHRPATPTESILVNAMVESHWLANRAQHLQNTCIDPASGAITNEKTFSLYARCQSTQTRAFHKALNDLLKLRAERRKAEFGVEAQKIAGEKHDMKKQAHYWDVLRKDGQACHQIGLNTIQNMEARQQYPGFEAEYAAELAKRGLENAGLGVAAQAA